MEQLFEEAKYRIRYEKGHFNSGFCILEDKKIVIINKFLDTESRINALHDILPQLEIRIDELSGEMKKWLQQLTEDENDALPIQTQLNLQNDEN